MNVVALPQPEQIVAEIQARRAELASLKKLLRVSRAASDAEQARRRRESLAGSRVGREEAARG